jgi:hypothetical protein
MTYQRRQRRWHAVASTALTATLATVATTLAPALPRAFADGTTTTSSTTTTTPAPPPPGLAAIQADAARLISNRVNALQEEIKVVQSKDFLGSDQATLVSQMQTDITNLQALGAKIAADTTLQAAIADRADIFTQVRTFFFVLPMARDVTQADWVTNVELPALNQEVAQIQAQESSANQAVVSSLLDSAQAQIQVAGNATAGLSAKLLAYTAAEWDADHALLVPAVQAIRSALRAIDFARDYLSRAERYLRHHVVPSTTTTTSSTTTTTSSTTTTTTMPGTSCSASVGGTALDRSAWVASSNAPSSIADQPANALDGNLTTRFSTDEPQASGLYFEVNMGSPQTFDELSMQVPNSPNDYARGFDVEVYNGISWVIVAACTGTGTSEVVSFPAQTAQYVAVILTTGISPWWWSIDEFNLYTSVPPTTTTTMASTTTTTMPTPPVPTPLPPGHHHVLRCFFHLKGWPRPLVPGSLVITPHGAFVVSFPCIVRPVHGVRIRVLVRISVRGRSHLEWGWSNRFRLGSPRGRNLVQLNVGGREWTEWNGQLYEAHSGPVARSRDPGPGSHHHSERR